MDSTCLNFFDHNRHDANSQAVIDACLEEATTAEKTGKFAVVLHNDSINGMEYVVKVIRSVFGYSLHKAIWLMLKAHCTGKSTLWIGPQRQAEQKRQQMIAHGPDPHMPRAQPLTVTVDRVD